jgi:uncharacterized membrane protein
VPIIAFTHDEIRDFPPNCAELIRGLPAASPPSLLLVSVSTPGAGRRAILNHQTASKNFRQNPKTIVLPSAVSVIHSSMSNLIVLDFDGIHTADEVLNKLRSLQKEHLIDLEDACVVERDKDGKVHIKQAVNMTALGAARGGSMGALWGTLVGLLFLNPLAGMVIGAAAGAGTGALSGSLIDYGINDDFVKKLGETIPVDSSALFVLVKSVTEDKVLAEIEHYKPRVLKTSLSNEDEAKLKAALSKAV